MRLALALACGLASTASTASAGLAAGPDVAELETLVLSGELTPKAAIAEYCRGETADKTQDAFCSSPGEALRLLEDRLRSYREDAG